MFRLLFLTISLLLSLVAAQCNLNPSFHSFSMGIFNITAINDGNLVLRQDFLEFPPESIERALRKVFRLTDPPFVGLNVFVVDTPDNRILFDTGAANTPEFGSDSFFTSAGMSLRNMRRAGIEPESIDSIILSHGHPDHVGGLIQPDGSLTFPNATVYVSRVEHEHWTAPIPDGPLPDFFLEIRTIYLRTVVPYETAGRLVLVEDNGRPLPFTRFLPTPGHTPGHSSIRLGAQGRVFLYAGDVFRARWDQIQHPEWGFRLDSNATLAIKSRIEFMDRFSDRENIVIGCTHENFPSVGRVVTVGPFFDWAPLDYANVGDVSTMCEAV